MENGGGKQIREIWQRFYPISHSMIYVIDGTDDTRFSETMDLLIEALSHRWMMGKPFFVYATYYSCLFLLLELTTLSCINKCDSPISITADMIQSRLSSPANQISLETYQIINTTALGLDRKAISSLSSDKTSTDNTHLFTSSYPPVTEPQVYATPQSKRNSVRSSLDYSPSLDSSVEPVIDPSLVAGLSWLIKMVSARWDELEMRCKNDHEESEREQDQKKKEDKARTNQETHTEMHNTPPESHHAKLGTRENQDGESQLDENV